MLFHQTAVRFNRRIARPILGRFLDANGYARIGAGFRPINVTAADLTAQAGDTGKAADILNRHGIVVLRDFIDPGLADAARHEADALAARLEAALAAPEDHGTVDGIVWQVDGALLRKHAAIEAQGRPWANIRSREPGAVNRGVIDFFFIDRSARENGWRALEACCDALQSPAAGEVIGRLSPARFRRANMLRSDSVTVTRGLHVDNLESSYKVFLYLSDVQGPDDGPYAYVPGSHRRLDLLRREARLNGLLGRMETDSYAFAGHEVALTARRGDAIISCQTGVHRGLPQRAGASRTVLVGNYRA